MICGAIHVKIVSKSSNNKGYYEDQVWEKFYELKNTYVRRVAT
jgi:hypothetical protein